MNTRVQYPAALPPVSTVDILDELDHAVANHLAWLRDWHRPLVCDETRTIGEAEAIEDRLQDSHHLCRFGAWFVKNQHRGLVDQPVIRNLAKLHHEMHDHAQVIVERVRAGQRPAVTDYDAFMMLFNGFLAQARRLEKAFAKASSDLDPLTGLHNRQAMFRELERERERALRTGRPCCVGLGDLDHFKRVNDTYGHIAGDRVLLASADRCLNHLRPYDAVYRFGGEEFLFCFPDTDLPTARKVLDRVREVISANPTKLETGEELTVTCSFGVARMVHGATLEQTIECADQALYWAKDQGRNRVCVWEGEIEPDTLIDIEPDA